MLNGLKINNDDVRLTSLDVIVLLSLLLTLNAQHIISRSWLPNFSVYLPNGITRISQCCIWFFDVFRQWRNGTLGKN